MRGPLGPKRQSTAGAAGLGYHAGMRVRVRLFAVLREGAGLAATDLELGPGATPEAAWQALVEAHPALASRRANLAAAVNRRYARFDAPLRDGDELAFVPPVSGG